MPAHTDQLPVLFDGAAIGCVVVTERTSRKCFGRFVPGDGFDKHRGLFDEAARWSRANTEPRDVGVDYAAWDRWMAAIEQLTAHISIPGLTATIEEFAIDEIRDVEITLNP